MAKLHEFVLYTTRVPAEAANRRTPPGRTSSDWTATRIRPRAHHPAAYKLAIARAIKRRPRTQAFWVVAVIRTTDGKIAYRTIIPLHEV